ncbi:MAG: hypothetical protein QOF62_907 [Pyrinomonadaceae bacterium]|nr:hypothetical protein [Pyrinomonadaceae bacterium]
MLSTRRYSLVGLTLLASIVAVNARTRSLNHDQITMPSDSEIIQLVEDCATGEGNPATLEKLRAMPRGKVYVALKRIRNGLRPDDALRVKVAFVSCLLGFEYSSNVQIVSSSLIKNPRYKNFYADDAASLISGLLAAKKDYSLFKVLFASIDWADGALAEELSATLTTQAQQETARFLSSLRPEPQRRRRKIYRLFHLGSMPSKDLEALRQHLSSVPKNSRLWATAREMLKAIA